MRRLFICASALGLLMAMPAVSAPNDDLNGNKHDTARTDTNAHPAHVNTQQNAPVRTMTGGAFSRAGGPTHNAPAMATTSPTYSRNAGSNARRTTSGNAFQANGLSNSGPAGNTAHRNSFGQTNPVATTSNSAMRGNNVGRSNTSAFANTTARNSNFASLRINVQSRHQFHDGNYSRPVNYEARHWGYGDRLPSAYYARNYWIGDFLMFGLFAPPEGLVWVRVGDDALLIDEYTGEVVQVDYGVFY